MGKPKPLTVEDLAIRYKVKSATLRKMQTDGFLHGVVVGRDLTSQMRKYLGNKRPLSSMMLLELARNPDLLHELRERESQARKIMADLGDIAATALPKSGYIHILGSALSEPASVNYIADWLMATIPNEGCGHHWLAVRMLWNLEGNQLKAAYSRAPRALRSARQLPRMEGWSETVDNQTRFMRPQNKFDL